MKFAAQCWILTVEQSDRGEALGVLTVCGDGTAGEPQSYESSGSLSNIFRELECALDATMSVFQAIADKQISPGQTFIV